MPILLSLILLIGLTKTLQANVLDKPIEEMTKDEVVVQWLNAEEKAQRYMELYESALCVITEKDNLLIKKNEYIKELLSRPLMPKLFGQFGASYILGSYDNQFKQGFNAFGQFNWMPVQRFSVYARLDYYTIANFEGRIGLQFLLY